MLSIVARDIQMSLGGNHILKGVSLSAENNRFIGIIGPNGSGKSTLLKCIYRVLKPTGGTVLLNGKPLSSYPTKQSAQSMAVVAQHNHVSFDFTVMDIVMMGRSPHKRTLESDTAEDRDIAKAAIERVGMLGFEKRSFASLSGGEQQRVILAQALCQQTKCIILDEPTNHLDIRYQLELMNIVKALDITVIAAIHDLNIAAMYCSELYALKDGRLAAHGTPDEVLTKALIQEIYAIRSEIIRDKAGYLHVLFNPQDV